MEGDINEIINRGKKKPRKVKGMTITAGAAPSVAKQLRKQ